jgi:hypothetical protein
MLGAGKCARRRRRLGPVGATGAIRPIPGAHDVCMTWRLIRHTALRCGSDRRSRCTQGAADASCRKRRRL